MDGRLIQRKNENIIHGSSKIFSSACKRVRLQLATPSPPLLRRISYSVSHITTQTSPISGKIGGDDDHTNQHIYDPTEHKIHGFSTVLMGTTNLTLNMLNEM